MSTAATPKSTGYSVARPTGTCALTGQPIAPDEHFIAVLRETLEGFERVDIKLDAWSDFDRTGMIAFWKTTMPRPEAKKKLLVDDAVLCDLLEKLTDVTEPAKLSFRFVLALILMRKKLIVYINSRKGDPHEIWTMRFKGRDDTFEIVDPRPTEDEIAAVQDQLGQILNEDI